MPITAPHKISMVIAGGAPIAPDTLADLLDDWLRIGTLTAVDARVYLPADERYISRAVSYAADWCDDREVVYDVVVGDQTGRKAQEITRGARDAIRSDADDDMTGDLIALLLEDHEQEGRTPFLIIAAGDAGSPDDETAALLGAAWDAGITVLEIAALALEEIRDAFGDTDPTPPAAPAGAPEPVVPETASVYETVQSLEIVQEREESMTRHPAGTADEAQATLPEIDVAEHHPDLPTTLAFVYTLLSAEDRANAARNTTEVKYRPLTMAVRHHFLELEGNAVTSAETVKEAPQSAEAAPVTELKPRGRTRAKEGEVAVLVDENGEVTDLAGKGRPPKGRTRKIIAIEDLPEDLRYRVEAA